MSLTAKILPNYTYEDYLHSEGDWEIIEGIPYAKSPAPSIIHQRIASRLNIILGNVLDQAKCSCEIIQPIDLKIADYIVLKPDLLTLCDKTPEQYVDFPPNLVIEILSPSTKLKDLNTKYELYQDFGIPYYIIIDPEESQIMVYQLKEGKYAPVTLTDGLSIDNGCQIYPSFDPLFD